MKNSKHINGVTLNKLATWEFPTWGNILVIKKHPEPRACAVICDRCVEEKRMPKYAVEWNKDFSVVKYHKLEDLQDLPVITADEVLHAEGAIFTP